MKPLTLTGRRFGRLLVGERAGSTPNGKTLWYVFCDCGVHKTVMGTHLMSGDTQSCGCLVADKMREKQQLPVGVAARNHVLRTYRKGAKARGLSWELSFEEFLCLVKSDCHYCGEPPSNVMFRKEASYNGTFVYNGIDRKDNSLGYTTSNVVPCCIVCNNAKRAMSYDAFIRYLLKAGKHQFGKRL